MTLPAWNVALFGCLHRDQARLRSLMRTQLSASLPAPFVSRKADTSAPVEVEFAIELSDDNFGAWQQWYTFDLYDGSLPFTMFLPWGTLQPQVRCRLHAGWKAQHLDVDRWQVTGTLEVERESLPRFSGGAR